MFILKNLIQTSCRFLYTATIVIFTASNSEAHEDAPNCAQFVEQDSQLLITELVFDIRGMKHKYATDQLDILVSYYLKQNSKLVNEPHFQLFMGYASLKNGRYLSAIGNAEVAQFLSERNSICQAKQVHFMATALRYEAIAILAEKDAGMAAYLGWTINLISHDGNFRLDEFEPAFCMYTMQLLNFSDEFKHGYCFWEKTE